ncbi:MAG: DUF503 domain-containing protein [Acidimicrobiales bacterium]|jgi:uncharacterized protein YlxP (DUF503 family)
MIGALEIELHFPAARSLKEKRSLLRPIIDTSRSRYRVAIAEIGHQDLHQRALLEVAAVAAAAHVITAELDAVERLVWSSPGLEVVSARRWWSDGE